MDYPVEISNIISTDRIEEFIIIKKSSLGEPSRLNCIARDDYCEGNCNKCMSLSTDMNYDYEIGLIYDRCCLSILSGLPIVNEINGYYVCNEIAMTMMTAFATEKCLNESKLKYREIIYSYICGERTNIIEGIIGYPVEMIDRDSIVTLIYQLATILDCLKSIKYCHGNPKLSTLLCRDQQFKQKTDKKTHTGIFQLVLYDLSGSSFEYQGRRFISTDYYYNIFGNKSEKPHNTAHPDKFEFNNNDIRVRHKYYNENSHCIDFILFFRDLVKSDSILNIILGDNLLKSIYKLMKGDSYYRNLLDIVIEKILNE